MAVAEVTDDDCSRRSAESRDSTDGLPLTVRERSFVLRPLDGKVCPEAVIQHDPTNAPVGWIADLPQINLRTAGSPFAELRAAYKSALHYPISDRAPRWAKTDNCSIAISRNSSLNPFSKARPRSSNRARRSLPGSGWSTWSTRSLSGTPNSRERAATALNLGKLRPCSKSNM